MITSLTASTDTHPHTGDIKRTVAVVAAVLVLTPAFGVAVALAALPFIAVAGLLVAVSLGAGSLLALAAGPGSREQRRPAGQRAHS